ncbi:MAG TPA: ADYC domain-containing protein, partial [Kofleriaceae bacterium]
NGLSLGNHHQACVRMLRADYCGNGHSYTTNGRLVNLYDGIGIQVDTESFRLEAEWAPDGARCLTNARRAAVSVQCYTGEPDPTCGDVAHFDSGTLIMNEIP